MINLLFDCMVWLKQLPVYKDINIKYEIKYIENFNAYML